MTQKFSDAARSNLSAGIASGDTTLYLDDGSKFPNSTVGTGALTSGDWFKLVLQDLSGIEICYVRTHDAVTTPNTASNVLRGQEGTTARAFAAGAVAGLRMTAADVGAFVSKTESLSNVDNTADVAKPVSTAQQAALDGKAPVNTTLTDAAAANTLPATTSTALTALLQTVRNCLKWLVSNTVQLTGNQTAAGVKTFSSRSSHAGAYTPSLTPAHSATPTFDCAASNSFEPGVMTSNVTSLTMSNPVAGQTVQIICKQDATGGRTHAVPSGAKIDGSINTGANRVSILVMTYYGAGSMWVGNWLQIPA